MGRSKFPGKPSKHVNRTRINVLCTAQDTTVGDSNNVVTLGTDDSKKAELQSEASSDQTESRSDELDKPVARRKHSKLVSKRAAFKRNGILQATKLSNQVPRRTRSAVTNRRSIRTFSTIRKVAKAKLSPTKEQNNLVGKFVLPSRSVHSSRVIKPNKRFINVDSNEGRTFKKRVNKRLCIRDADDQSKAASEETKQNSRGKVVLRQARLQLHTQNTAGPEGPFSCTTSNTVSPPGTVTCGVCGAVRFYRFVKQARKFNIYSCESCRKFISKMIKRHSNTVNNPISLVCHKGQGTCHVPPIVRSQQWKLFRCAYRARCPACWLKMCLRSFQMPVTLRNSLAQLLPKNMQTCDVMFSNSLPLLSWQANIDSNHEKSLPPLVKEDEPQEVAVRRRPVRLSAIKKECKQIIPRPPLEIKRQKVDLKGPRVKHVCRSASIVLGQPLATFPAEQKKSDIEDKDDIKTSDKDIKILQKDIEIEKIETDNDDTSLSGSDKLLGGIKNVCKTDYTKKDRTAKPIVATTQSEHKLIPYMKKNIISRLNTIAIDFWENYDPDEIIRNGFGLMSSESFPMKAICFLCGSAGQETLLHCLTCCEPYHPYCLDQSPNNSFDENGKHGGDWLCPRCTTCNACGQADRQKINCLKCNKAYHPNCLNSMWKRDDKPTVCSNCLRCKSCGTGNIKKFVGNLALCHVCFKLRNKGNYCPLCQKCYDDNDFETKMMECAKCKKWVHANCESLADEQYQILSLLPDSVEFLCRLCSSQSTPYWKDAICNELKASFNHVLRLLSKNRMARNLLKLSPYKPMTIAGRIPISVRKIQFRDDNTVDETKESEKVLIRRQSSESQDSVDKQESKLPVSPTMVDIKNKLNSNEYISLQEFNNGMEHALKGADIELLKIYHLVLKEVFPWYDPSIKDPIYSMTVNATLSTPKRYTNYDNKNKDDDKIDNRMCGLCKDIGDGLPDREARLLYCGQNEWVHANCALWSSEVYEEIDGSLQNVHSALSRGRLIKCALCKQKGASVGCCEKGCHETYHFGCALKINCYFLHDKTVYCPTHKIVPSPQLLSTPSDFDIRRSVYVEIDRKKKRYCEPDKIHYMVGSLSVTNLGKIIPVLSDDIDALVPLGFVCTRLFWSMTEPWKVIPYNITTSILNSQINSIYVDRNFTVDHSLPKSVVDQKYKEILSWQRDLSKDSMEPEFEEEQHGTDLFSPEITDEIFADLPHDFLDGLSEQDMMMYDDLLNMDFKSDMNYSDNIVNNDAKKEFPEEDTTRELKRSKSEVFNQLGAVDKISKNRSHQRSCSLTLSCKLDTPVIKKRKMAPRDSNMFFQLLQVDGACDSSECGSPVGFDDPSHEDLATPVCKKRKAYNIDFQLLQVDGAYDSSESECGSPNNGTEEVWSFEASEEPVTCERCQCTYRTRASYTRHLENCDALSTSESDSDEQQTAAENIIIREVTQHPKVIASYESFSSYQTTQNEVHSTILNTQTMVTSEATSEVITVPENGGFMYPTYQEQMLNQKGGLSINGLITQPNITVNRQHPSLEETNIAINQSQISTNQSFYLESQNLSLNHGLISLDNSSITLNQPNPISINPITINQPTSLSLNQPVEIQQPVTFQSLPFTSQDVSPLLNITPQNQITIDTKMIAAPCSNIVNVTVPQNQMFKPIIKPMVTQKAIRPRAKPRNLAAKTNRLPARSAIIMPQTNATAPMIVQHLPSSNMVPTFVDAFQQQSGQNLQYVATIAPQPQLVQIQPENNFLSLVNGVQPTMIIQQPRMVTDQLIVDGNGSMMWATQPVQPVYYGFETIVQNTVMQSQQFLPTTVSGVLTTNSSYSATTQVFQTSKLEPVIDVGQGGFVLVNSGHTVNPTSIQMPFEISQNVSHNLPATSKISMPQVQSNRIEPKVNHWNLEPQRNVEIPTSQQIHHHQQITHPKPPTSLVNQHCITLPIAPFVPEQGIPTNIVTPTLKPPTSSRPMSRVLPMQTNAPREQRKPVIEEKPVLENIKDKIANYKPKITLLENIIVKEENQNHPLKKIERVDVVKSQIDITKQQTDRIRLETAKNQDSKKIIIHSINKLDVSKNNYDLLKKEIVKNKSVFTHQKIVHKDDVNPKMVSLSKVDEQPLVTALTQFDHLKLPEQLEIEAKNLDIARPVDITNDTNIVKMGMEHIDISETVEEAVLPDVPVESPSYKLNILEKEPPPANNNLTPKDLQSIEIAAMKLRTEEKSMPLLDEITDEKLETPPETDFVKPPIILNKPKVIEKPPNPQKNGSSVLYTVETRDGFRYSSTSIYELWSKVFEAVQSARAAHNMSPLPANALDMINNLQLLGLKTNGLRYLLEQLPGASKCTKYKPAFHTPTTTEDSDDDMDIGSTSGAIRSVPYGRKKEHNDMFGWLASKHRKPESCLLDTDLLPRRGSITNLPMAMRFRQLKLTSKLSVGVYRSGIHRRGLFSLRDIESGEMVIEYAGEVIRSILTDKREKYYNSKGIGCYMFRIDDNLVVDATMKGNAARFINHSCDPNCYSKVVEIHGHKHIIIFALRRIIYGEELTYDYKFPFEEDKIPCTCGARRCRKFLN